MLAPAGKIYLCGDVEIDTGREVIRRAGQQIILRPKTFSLLVYLIQHRERLVPKEELIARLWANTAVTDGAIAQGVADIRRAFDEDPKNPRFIRTAARRGYQFIGPVETAETGPPPQPRATGVQEIVEERIEYSEELIEDEPPALDARPIALLPPPRRRLPRIVLVCGLLALALTAALAAWNRWLRPAPEPEWWEVAWWKLNEGQGSRITDSVHGLAATFPAGVSWTPGVSGAALRFTGGPYQLSGSDPGVLPTAAAPRTLLVWIKTNTTNADSTHILALGDRASEANEVSVQLRESGTAALTSGHFVLEGKKIIVDDRWHQVVGIFDPQASRPMRLFVDGAEEAATPLAYRLSPFKSPQWSIGTSFWSGHTTFRGTIDDARIFERALRPDEIRSLYRCMVSANDIEIQGGRSYYFVPIYGDHVEILPRDPGETSARIKNVGTDFAGAMFVLRDPDCGLRSLHGANLGQDLTIELELRVPTGPAGAVTDGGPYFRSRRANPGDGILGGTSAGFWVRLDSTGQVRVQCLNPGAILGFSNASQHFDSSVFHKLKASVHGDTLVVDLDGRPLTFDVAGVQRSSLQLPRMWEAASPKGINGGSAGIAFGCTRNRDQAGGQEARNIRITNR